MKGMQLCPSACECPVSPAPFIEETTLLLSSIPFLVKIFAHLLRLGLFLGSVVTYVFFFFYMLF